MILAKTYQGSSSIHVNQQIHNLLEVNVFVHMYIAWVCFIDRVNWTKLMQILKSTGIDWRERRLISKLCMD
jgi:hypothetical protein